MTNVSGETPSGPDSITYLPDEGVYRASFDGSATDPSIAVVDVLSAVRGSESLEPLYESIDPDALDQFFEGCSAAARTTDFSIRFTHGGYEVTIRSEETIEVTPV